MSEVQMAATIIGQHQRVIGKTGHPCWCLRWPDHVNRDGQGWHEHLAEELAAAGLLKHPTSELTPDAQTRETERNNVRD